MCILVFFVCLVVEASEFKLFSCNANRLTGITAAMTKHEMNMKPHRKVWFGVWFGRWCECELIHFVKTTTDYINHFNIYLIPERMKIISWSRTNYEDALASESRTRITVWPKNEIKITCFFCLLWKLIFCPEKLKDDDRVYEYDEEMMRKNPEFNNHYTLAMTSPSKWAARMRETTARMRHMSNMSSNLQLMGIKWLINYMEVLLVSDSHLRRTSLFGNRAFQI